MASDKNDLYVRAQRRLVGSLLFDSESISRVLELVKEADIEEANYNIIFSKMAELSRLDEKISVYSVAEMLEREGNLTKVGGPKELTALYYEGEKYLLEADSIIYARIIKEASAKSKLSTSLKESMKNFKHDSGVQASEAISELQSELNEELLSLSDDSTITQLSNEFDKYSETIEERKRITEENAQDAEGLIGIPTLIPTINKLTRGWSPGQLITVGAGTGIGKSIFAINCGVAAGEANNSVMIFSLEMGETEIYDRIFSSTTGIPLNDLKVGRLDDDQRKLLKQQMENMKNVKITVDVEPKQTIDTIRARALRQAQSPAGLDFIIVDYLQLVVPTGKFSSRQEAVADLSRNMKLLAKQLGVPIMVLVQLNTRKKDENDSGMPNLNDIRESAAIAQDSDVVILLHRELPQDETTPYTSILLAKNRGGQANVIIRCHTNLGCSIFREIKRVKDIEDESEDDFSMSGNEDSDLSDIEDTDDYNTDLLEDFDEDIEDLDDLDNFEF